MGSAQDLLVAIEQTLQGQFSANYELTTVMIEGFANASRAKGTDPTTCSLTTRQSHIVPLLKQGLSNKEIARLLGIEIATVKNHVHTILVRMQLSRRGQIASRNGLFAVDWAAPLVLFASSLGC